MDARIIGRSGFFLLLILAANAGANTVVVPTQVATIQEAISVLTDGDSILVEPGTYSGEGFVEIDFTGKAITVTGLKGAEFPILENADPRSIFYIRNGEGPGTVLRGITFRGAYAYYWYDAAVRIDGASPTLQNLVFENCYGPLGGHYKEGAALSIHGDASPVVEDCIFRNNSAAYGPAVFCSEAGSPIFTNVIIEGNEGRRGGAVYLSDCTPEFYNARFLRNRAVDVWTDEINHSAGYGGAVYCGWYADALFEYCLFDGNKAEASLVDDDVNFPTSGEGGAACVVNAAPEFNKCTFHGNRAEVALETGSRGGALHGRDGAWLVLMQTIVAFSSEGGGIYLFDVFSDAMVWCCDVYGNVGGDYLGSLQDQTGIYSNISADPRFCAPSAGDFHLAEDSPCLPENNDCGHLMGAYAMGCDPTAVDAPAPIGFTLAQNHPNPFNPKTEIAFTLLAPARVTLAIHDLAGRRVAVLLDSALRGPGRHAVAWDARDAEGGPLASGVYICRLDASGHSRTRKLTLLK